ncbi:MAG: CoA pyrophosphatase [Desulfobacula sp.]|nr:CoA pyrophosphatase [Desulfobacula sp.]
MDKIKSLSNISKAIQIASHPGAPDDNLFQPTSVIVLFAVNEEVELLFIQKADVKGYPWANQMAFPGGHKDKNDLSTKDTALRELSEEMGIIQDNVEIIGSLGHFQTINSKDIEAFAGIWNQKDIIKHDPAEISRVFKIPLKYLINIHRKSDFHLNKPNIMQLKYPFKDVMIWGVTAKILYHLIDCLLQNADL